MYRTLPALIVLAACGPSDQSIRDLEAKLVVTPPEVDFGQVAALSSADQIVTIDNAGQAKLEVSLRLEGDNPNQFSIPLNTLEIPRDEIPFSLPVTFAPKTYLPYAATLVVESNDPDNERLEIPLMGEGIFDETPDICITPGSLDFGSVDPGQTAQGTLYVENCGQATLELGTVSLTGSDTFTMEPLTDPTGAILAEGEQQPIVFYYSPDGTDGDNATLAIQALNDPDEDEQLAIILGNGGGPDLDRPVAVIDCPTNVSAPEVVQFDGTDSYDPNGFGIFYLWELNQAPQGSQAAISDPIADTTSVFADLSSTYEVQLTVTNTANLTSEPTLCVIDAIPDDDLQIELTWDTTGVDLDLHLLQNTTAQIFDVPEDCNFCNLNPDWANAGADDDPLLELDDRSDGPESTNIVSPADGTYPVVVHYYPGSNTPTLATVKIYAYGAELHSVSAVLTENQVWEVGQVNWGANPSFGEYPLNLYPSTRTSCP